MNKKLILVVLSIVSVIGIIGFILYLLISRGIITTGLVKTDFSGEVFAQDGIRGVPNANVLLDTGEQTKTDDKGIFYFYDVPSGSHTVTVSTSLHKPQSVQVEVKPEVEAVTVNLEIKSFKTDEIFLAQHLETFIGGNVTVFDADGRELLFIKDAADARFGKDGKSIEFEYEKNLHTVQIDGSGRKRIGKISKKTEVKDMTSLESTNGEYVLSSDDDNLYMLSAKSVQSGKEVFTFPERSEAVWVGNTSKVLYKYFDSRTLATKYLVKDVATEEKEEELFSIKPGGQSISLEYITWSPSADSFFYEGVIYGLDGTKTELPGKRGAFMPDGTMMLIFSEIDDTDYEEGTYLFSPKGKLIKKIADERMEKDVFMSHSGEKLILTNDFDLFMYDVKTQQLDKITDFAATRRRFNTVEWIQEQ